MGRGIPADTGKPEFLYQCQDQFFDSVAVSKDGRNFKQIGQKAGEASVANLGVELAELAVTDSDLETNDRAGDENQNLSQAGSDLGTRWTCNGCKCSFQSSDEQRSHFKADWHRLNVKRRVVGKEPISEDDFTKVAEGQWKGDNDDVSSISGSDSESDDPDSGSADGGGLKRMTHRSNRIHFILQNSGESISLWRAVVLNEGEYTQSEKGFTDDQISNDVHCLTDAKLLQRLKSLIPPAPKGMENVGASLYTWTILLSAGGHFAGVVMNMQGGGVLAHNTFHRYVVRAKAGGRQSTRDATGRAPQSAGASLRRYNEMALQKEIRELLNSWGTYLRSASHIFVYAPSANAQALFGGENAPLDRNDPRIRRIPFTTRRPTFKEAQRVFRVLTTITYDGEVPASIDTPAVVSDSKAEKKKEVKQSGKKLDGGSRSTESSKPSVSRTPEDVSGTSVAEEPVIKGTPLHEAAKAGNNDLVLRLLEDGLDPCARDERGKTPYALAGDKETRNVFRRYMARFPDQWDWHAADVPSALTEEMELAQAAREVIPFGSEKSSVFSFQISCRLLNYLRDVLATVILICKTQTISLFISELSCLFQFVNYFNLQSNDFNALCGLGQMLSSVKWEFVLVVLELIVNMTKTGLYCEVPFLSSSFQAEKKAKRKELEKEKKKQRKEQEKKKEAEKKAAELAAAAVAKVRGTSDVKSFSKVPAPDTKSAAYQAAVAQAQAAEREARAAAAEARMRTLMASKEAQPTQASSSSSRNSASGASLCSCCGDSLTGKTPFYKFSYSYCSTTCVQVHRKYLESEGQ
ncbi:hypothetical protein R1flu_028765 [Riccia fluitans]|uniref:VLRF1 domain-containing protein n=1 Tax=Riccia fluitans TaxID=41844 RepID=A0ABD1XML0_9MARC